MKTNEQENEKINGEVNGEINEKGNKKYQLLAKLMQQLLGIMAVICVTIIGMFVLYCIPENVLNSQKTTNIQDNYTKNNTTNIAKIATISFWIAPDIDKISDKNLKAQVAYGKELIAHTAKYLGLKGSVKSISNGMNCQNCHLDAGTKTFGNNYGSVASLYPKFRARSNSIENIYKRVNDCFERSLNGKGLDSTSKEMQAIKAYITYLGTNVIKGKKAEGSGFKDLAYLDRAASVEKGKIVYIAKCQSCHQANGEGQLQADGIEYLYPPFGEKIVIMMLRACLELVILQNTLNIICLWVQLTKIQC